MKNYKIKKNKKLIKQLKPYWNQVHKYYSKFFIELNRLEKKMELETGIKGIGFFFCDEEIAGIGNNERTMELIHSSELEKK